MNTEFSRYLIFLWCYNSICQMPSGQITARGFTECIEYMFENTFGVFLWESMVTLKLTLFKQLIFSCGTGSTQVHWMTDPGIVVRIKIKRSTADFVFYCFFVNVFSFIIDGNKNSILIQINFFAFMYIFFFLSCNIIFSMNVGCYYDPVDFVALNNA